MPLHTILGANGAVGRELSRALHASGHPLRQVSRRPAREFPTDEIVVADLTDAMSTHAAIAGSDVVYLVAGGCAGVLRQCVRVWHRVRHDDRNNAI